ncbi:hypothetical protein BpHYR1_030190 [Brachionus plicatilis]|uniref:Uncharacterized protein n=1 Tax=Brachionus plicatilis TaxID=10195 RepID=A0A3M7P1B8_BRAPC|nr:hypothetical protein BpHYR1_030190 [Brachionus plicatilis]
MVRSCRHLLKSKKSKSSLSPFSQISGSSVTHPPGTVGRVVLEVVGPLGVVVLVVVDPLLVVVVVDLVVVVVVETGHDHKKSKFNYQLKMKNK